MLVNIIVVSIIGIIAGSIVNILADDLPHYRWPRLPRYPDGTSRPPIAWLSILAFAVRRRNSPHGSRLSWRYPLAEIITAVGMVTAVLVKNARPDVSDVQVIFWLIYIAMMVLITIIDIEHKLILFSVIIPSAFIALLDAIITPTQREPDLGGALLAGVIGFGVFFILYLGGILYVTVANQRGRRITEVAFGYGDVMLITVGGFILGPGALIFAMFITVFAGALGAVIYLVGRMLRSDGYSPFTALPYGPYIVLGVLTMMLFGSQVRYLLIGY